MKLNEAEKRGIKAEIVEQLRGESEVSRIIIFGSFVKEKTPNDIDVAVFQTSKEPYFPLAIKYRKKLSAIADRIPVDVIPIRPNPEKSPFLDEILAGEVVYER